MNSHTEVPSQTRDLRFRAGPDGLLLFNRSTGLNVLLDEIRIPEAEWAKAPRQVSIALTNACDLECSYCYAPKTPNNLDPGKIEEWLSELDENGALGIGFGGGEPTLHKHLADLCEYAAHRTGLAVTLTTHALRLNEPLVDRLLGNVHFIRISMDGVWTTYEKLRKRPFDMFLKQLEVAMRVAPVGINYVVNSDSIKDLDAAATLASDLRVVEFLLLPEQPSRGTLGIDHETSRAFQRWVADYHGNLRLVVSEQGSEGLPVCNPFQNEVALSAYAHIDATGTIKRTSFDEKGILIGNQGVIEALSQLRKE